MRSSQDEGKQIHALIWILGFNSVIFLQTSLINLYSASGNLEDAHQVFDEVHCQNSVCWTSLISAYMNNGKPSEALKLFKEMQEGDVEPDQVTVTIALSACASLETLETGQQIHDYVRCKPGFKADLCFNNALINMYVKCGDISAARRIFDRLSERERDVMTWTSMIVGHALHGEANEALRIFAEMERKCRNGSVLPDEVTFIGVLMACSHAGMVEEGWQQFRDMKKKYGIKPRITHYGCMVDLLCRAGLLQEAHEFITNMPIKPNAVVWRTLLAACSLRGHIELGVIVRSKLVEMDPAYVGDDVAMSNTYASAGMWEEKMAVRAHIKHRRPPGSSLIELEDGIHRFVAADRSNPLSREVYQVLQIMTMEVSDSLPESPNMAGKQPNLVLAELEQ